MRAERRIVTFAVGGPLRGYYMDLQVKPEENDGVDGMGTRFTANFVIWSWCREHFPVDFYTTYDPAEFEPRIAEFNLLLLAKGRIEHYNGKNFFHEAQR